MFRVAIIQLCAKTMNSACLNLPKALFYRHTVVVAQCCLLGLSAGEAALKSAQLELQLQSRKQEAEVEMVQTKLQQQAAALVRDQDRSRRSGQRGQQHS